MPYDGTSSLPGENPTLPVVGGVDLSPKNISVPPREEGSITLNFSDADVDVEALFSNQEVLVTNTRNSLAISTIENKTFYIKLVEANTEKSAHYNKEDNLQFGLLQLFALEVYRKTLDTEDSKLLPQANLIFKDNRYYLITEDAEPLVNGVKSVKKATEVFKDISEINDSILFSSFKDAAIRLSNNKSIDKSAAEKAFLDAGIELKKQLLSFSDIPVGLTKLLDAISNNSDLDFLLNHLEEDTLKEINKLDLNLPAFTVFQKTLNTVYVKSEKEFFNRKKALLIHLDKVKAHYTPEDFKKITQKINAISVDNISALELEDIETTFENIKQHLLNDLKINAKVLGIDVKAFFKLIIMAKMMDENDLNLGNIVFDKAGKGFCYDTDQACTDLNPSINNQVQALYKSKRLSSDNKSESILLQLDNESIIHNEKATQWLNGLAFLLKSLQTEYREEIELAYAELKSVFESHASIQGSIVHTNEAGKDNSSEKIQKPIIEEIKDKVKENYLSFKETDNSFVDSCLKKLADKLENNVNNAKLSNYLEYELEPKVDGQKSLGKTKPSLTEKVSWFTKFKNLFGRKAANTQQEPQSVKFSHRKNSTSYIFSVLPWKNPASNIKAKVSIKNPSINADRQPSISSNFSFKNLLRCFGFLSANTEPKVNDLPKEQPHSPQPLMNNYKN